MPVYTDLCSRIAPPDAAAMAAAGSRLDRLTKPPGSLGRLEELVVRLAGITGAVTPCADPAVVLVFAADHGVTAEGVSAYPSEVTPQMVLNFLYGGAAINALARQASAPVRVIDVGVAADLSHPNLISRKVRPGTANMAAGPAMSRVEAEQALQVGIELAQAEIAAGARCLILGEMGIGNTTPSATLLCALTGTHPELACGRGTGLDEAGLNRKIAVVRRALAFHRPDPSDPVGVLAAVGGLEIGAIAGALLAAAAARVPVLLDGFIAGAAALVACAIEPRTAAYLIAAHCSAEPGHRLVLEHLGLRPLLELNLRLGEGTGAALALPLLQGACRFMSEMATFEEAGVSTSDAPESEGGSQPARPA